MARPRRGSSLRAGTRGTTRALATSISDSSATLILRSSAAGRRQDTSAILDSLNKVAVVPGDTVLVPAGVPHAIGAGSRCGAGRTHGFLDPPRGRFASTAKEGIWAWDSMSRSPRLTSALGRAPPAHPAEPRPDAAQRRGYPLAATECRPVLPGPASRRIRTGDLRSWLRHPDRRCWRRPDHPLHGCLAVRRGATILVPHSAARPPSKPMSRRCAVSRRCLSLRSRGVRTPCTHPGRASLGGFHSAATARRQ